MLNSEVKSSYPNLAGGKRPCRKGQYLVLNELVMQKKKKKNLHQLVSLAAVNTPTKELLLLLTIRFFFDS